MATPDPPTFSLSYFLPDSPHDVLIARVPLLLKHGSRNIEPDEEPLSEFRMPLTDFPEEIAIHIMSFLNWKDLFSLGMVSREFRRVSSIDFLWSPFLSNESVLLEESARQMYFRGAGDWVAQRDLLTTWADEHDYATVWRPQSVQTPEGFCAAISRNTQVNSEKLHSKDPTNYPTALIPRCCLRCITDPDDEKSLRISPEYDSLREEFFSRLSAPTRASLLHHQWLPLDEHGLTERHTRDSPLSPPHPHRKLMFFGHCLGFLIVPILVVLLTLASVILLIVADRRVISAHRTREIVNGVSAVCAASAVLLLALVMIASLIFHEGILSCLWHRRLRKAAILREEILPQLLLTSARTWVRSSRIGFMPRSLETATRWIPNVFYFGSRIPLFLVLFGAFCVIPAMACASAVFSLHGRIALLPIWLVFASVVAFFVLHYLLLSRHHPQKWGSEVVSLRAILWIPFCGLSLPSWGLPLIGFTVGVFEPGGVGSIVTGIVSAVLLILPCCSLLTIFVYVLYSVICAFQDCRCCIPPIQHFSELSECCCPGLLDSLEKNGYIAPLVMIGIAQVLFCFLVILLLGAGSAFFFSGIGWISLVIVLIINFACCLGWLVVYCANCAIEKNVGTTLS